MRRTKLGAEAVGVELAKPIFNEKGQVLLTAGTALTPGYVSALARRGVQAVAVQDPATKDIVMEDVISDELRIQATGAVGKVYDVLEAAATGIGGGDPRRAAAAADSTEMRRSTANVPLDTIYDAVEDILGEALDAPLLSGLNSIKAYDNYTYCHSVDVTVTAIMIGARLRLNKGDLRRLARGCLLHDVGKIFVPGDILRKEGKLSDDEYHTIQEHPATGYTLLRQIHRDDVIANHIAYQHHERQDGKGYPRGLRGTNGLARAPQSEGHMLLLAEVAAIADIHDALASDRPYRPALPPEVVAEQIRKMAGMHLNREIVEAFLAVLPVFPVGVEVRVTAGRYRGFTGVVARLNRLQLDRPVVRLLTNARGQQIIPLDVDLLRYPEMQIATNVPETTLALAGQ